jgi:CheY-like chemotaxis protein
MTEGDEIVLVDDDEADVELALHALRGKMVARITVLRDGEEAIDYLCSSSSVPRWTSGRAPKLILLDLKLPKVDGIEVLRRIKSDPETKFIPVVVLTSSREEQDLVRSYKLGVNSYIQKPLDFDNFRAIVSQLGRYWLEINRSPPIPIGVGDLRTAV